jgi:hypothetical protein
VSFRGVVPGQSYTIVVTGATGDVFDVGGYALTVAFPDGTPPVPPPPPTSPAPPPLAGSPGPVAVTPTNDSRERATALGPIIPGEITDVAITGSPAAAWFSFEAVQPGTYEVSTTGEQVSLFNVRGKRIAARFGGLDLRMLHGHATLYVEVSTASGGPMAPGTMTITLKKVGAATYSHAGARPARAPARFPRPHPVAVTARGESTPAHRVLSGSRPPAKPAGTTAR